MTPARAGRTRPVVGFLVNPIAGIGGRVGLKGSDGPDAAARALALGAEPTAGLRAEAAVRQMLAAWPLPLEPPVVLAGPAEMGESAATAAGARPDVIGAIVEGATTAEDTVRLARLMAARRVDLLLFAGGDGTARDLHEALRSEGDPVPVIGIPAGVKIQSAVFATSPRAAGDVAARFVAREPGRRRTEPREVVDLDEDAYRRGEIAPRLWGELVVPADRRAVQARKAPTPLSEAAAVAAIAEELVAASPIGARLVLGPGSTVRAIAERLGVPKTLVGVDVVEIVAPGVATLVVADASEAALRPLAEAAPCSIVVTPIGGQGFVFGRGNQPISPSVIRAVIRRHGRGAILIVATPAKLAAIAPGPLLVDTGDPSLDEELAGHVQVITGRGERAIARVAAA